jgi:ubiquinone/menaquinone biosynthesis C-methylase UbiE
MDTLLVELGANVTVVEPDDDMRAVLERRSPGVHSLSGRAEHLPVFDESFDAVLISSAWHWFEQPESTIEMARVLRQRQNLRVVERFQARRAVVSSTYGTSRKSDRYR